MSLRSNSTVYNKLYLVWSVGWNSDCYERGKTFRVAVETEIQTSCNLKANLCDRHYLWNVCTVISAIRCWNRLLVLWCGIIVTSLCLVISTFSYTKIFFTLRRHRNQVQGHVPQPNQTNQLNIARYKKAVSTAIWLQLTLVACYLPDCVVAPSGPSSTRPCAWIYIGTLIFLNSSLNPILYCWKIKEVRQAVKNTIREVLCHCFSTT